MGCFYSKKNITTIEIQPINCKKELDEINKFEINHSNKCKVILNGTIIAECENNEIIDGNINKFLYNKNKIRNTLFSSEHNFKRFFYRKYNTKR